MRGLYHKKHNEYTKVMLLRLSKWWLKLALFTPLIVTPLFVSSLFSFPVNAFFPFISLKAIFFRVVVEAALFFLIAHLICSADRQVQFRAVLRKLKQPIVIATGIFCLILFISALLGENPTQSLWSNFERGEGVFQILHYALFFVLLYVLVTDKQEIHRFIRLHLIVSFFVCLYALPQFFGVQNIFHTIGGSGRIAGTLGNPSYLAAYLLINFAFIFYAYTQAATRRGKNLLIGLAVFQLFIFLNTGTRAAYLALAVGVALIYCLTIFTTRNPKYRARLVLTLVGGILLFGTGLGVYHTFPELQQNVILDRLFNLEGAVKGFQPRAWTWESALHGISDRPLLGWGAENFAYSFDRYYNPNHYGGESFFDRTHNIFLEHLISGGIILLISYLAIWFFYYRAIRGSERTMWRNVLITMPIVYFVQGFFLFDVLPVYLITFLFMAFSLNLMAGPENTQLEENGYEAGHPELLTIIGLSALLFFVIITTAIIPWKKNLLITRAYSISPDQPQAIFNAFQDAILYRSVIGQEEAVSGLLKFSIDLLDAAAAQRTPVAPEIIRGIVDTNNAWFENYRPIMSGLRNWYLSGALNLRVGLNFNIPEYTERGKQLYAEALAISPTRIEFLQVLLEAARATKNRDEFEAVYERVKTLRPDIPWVPFDVAIAPATP